MAGPLGASPGIIVGVGVGTAAAAAIEPIVEPARQEAWDKNRNAILDPDILARLAAQGGITLEAAKTTGHLHGLTDDKMAALVYLEQTVPGVSEALTLLRRQSALGNDFTALFNHALVKAGIDPRYVPAITGLQGTLLSPEVMAQGVQQGHVPNDGILPGLPTPTHIPAGYHTPDAPDGYAPTDVPLTTINLDPIAQSAGHGTDLDQLKVLANLAGLPPGAQELLTLWNRNLVTESAVDAGLREGHLKTKWADAFKRLRWNVLSHIQYVDARVRGWIDNEEMYKGGALHGFTEAQMDMLHRTHGRPLSWHQVWIGLQRGGKRLDPVADIDGPSLGIDDTFFKALQQSDIQQQWYDLAWAQRYNYPSAFVLRQLRESNSITDNTLRTVLKYIGWEPSFVDEVAKSWTPKDAGTTTAKKDTVTLLTQEYLAGVLSPAAFTTALGGLGYSPEQAAAMMTNADFKASSAERTRNTKLVEKQYVGLATTESQARSQLATLGWPQGVIDNKIGVWNVERELQATTLTVTQIVKGLTSGALTPAQAIPLLQDLGEDPAAIDLIIRSNPPKA